MPRPTCVIYNPAAGRGKAQRLLEKAKNAGRTDFDYRATTHPGEGGTLTEQAIAEGYHRIIAAGGDGTVHEVANGVLRTGRTDVVFGVWPWGSMNDYAAAIGQRELMNLESPEDPPTFLADVGLVRVGDKPERFFVNGIGVGFNGMVTIEARKMRKLRGTPLYTTAFVKAMVKHFHKPDLTIQFDEASTTSPTLALTVNLGPTEGGFRVTPQADLTDGLFDIVHARDLQRWHLLRYLPNLLFGRLPADHPQMKTQQARRIEVRSTRPLCVHADGELLCVPEDEVTRLEAAILPARLRVEGKPGGAGSKSSA